MSAHGEPADLRQVLERMRAAAGARERVSIADMLNAVGRRSYGPVLLVIGLVTLSPIGDVPGVPTLMALLLVLTAGQLLSGRSHFWLPRWLAARSVKAPSVEKAVRFLQRPAAFADRMLRRRLAGLTARNGTRVIAALVILIALAMPPMELVPFTATGAGVAITGFGLALVAHDGLLALIAYGLTVAALAAVVLGFF